MESKPITPEYRKLVSEYVDIQQQIKKLQDRKKAIIKQIKNL